jgi:hypothetical protein
MAETCSHLKTMCGACETTTRSGEVDEDEGEAHLWLELMVDGRSNFKRTKFKIQCKSKRRG